LGFFAVDRPARLQSTSDRRPTAVHKRAMFDLSSVVNVPNLTAEMIRNSIAWEK
jgi:hypothetical protein